MKTLKGEKVRPCQFGEAGSLKNDPTHPDDRQKRQQNGTADNFRWKGKRIMGFFVQSIIPVSSSNLF